MNTFIHKIAGLFDVLNRYWTGAKNQKMIGAALVLVYLLTLLIVFIHKNTGFLAGWKTAVFDNYFSAISLAFIFLLIVEILSLVFVLSQSVTRSLIKQFEILSLILLRDAFKEFGDLEELVSWHSLNDPIFHILTDAFGAVLIFLIIAFITRIKKNEMITKNEKEQSSFINMKKIIALSLIAVFIVLGITELIRSQFFGLPGHFFYHFYTALIFSDILIVLISLRYNYSYLVLFRNSGFALATVLIRLALISPPYFNIILGVSAGILTLGIVLVYSRIYKVW